MTNRWLAEVERGVAPEGHIINDLLMTHNFQTHNFLNLGKSSIRCWTLTFKWQKYVLILLKMTSDLKFDPRLKISFWKFSLNLTDHFHL